jgi:hypothetical protein
MHVRGTTALQPKVFLTRIHPFSVCKLLTLTMSGAVPLLPLRALMVWTGTTLYLPLTVTANSITHITYPLGTPLLQVEMKLCIFFNRNNELQWNL